MPVFTNDGRLLNDYIGILTVLTVLLSRERCRYDDNGAEGSVTVLRSLELCRRVVAGVSAPGTVHPGPAAVSPAFYTVTKAVMLAETLRHRYEG